MISYGSLFGYNIFDFPKPEPVNLSYEPLSFDGWRLQTNGLAHAIAAECGYSMGVGGWFESMNITFLVHGTILNTALLFCPNGQEWGRGDKRAG
jgi:hypothetical protein